MSSERPPTAADFGLLFALAFRCYVDRLHDELAARGFPPPRSSFGPILRALHGRERTLTALARDLATTKQGAGRAVGDMRAAGLVEQRRDPADGRSRVLLLTPRGEAMVTAAIEIGEAYEAELHAVLGAAPARVLRGALEAMVERGEASADLAARRVRVL